MKDPTTLHESYAAWWERIRPHGAHPIQTEEMARAFYSGAMVMFGLITQASSMDEEAACRNMDALNLELGDWLARMQAQADAQDAQGKH